jgi:hypothetical protein
VELLDNRFWTDLTLDVPLLFSGYAHLSDFDLLVRRSAEMEDLLVQHDRELKDLRRMVLQRHDFSQPSYSGDRFPSQQGREDHAGHDHPSSWMPFNEIDAVDHPGPSTERVGRLAWDPETRSPNKRRRMESLAPVEDTGFSRFIVHRSERTEPPGDLSRPFIHHSRPPSGAPSLADHNAALVLEVSSL